MSCEKCKAGHYAPKALEYGHFDSFPEFMVVGCAETTDFGSMERCDEILGFHANKDGELDSGIGLPVGQKINMRFVFSIDDPIGGTGFLEYKLLGAKREEVGRLSIDGQVFDYLVHSSPGNTEWQQLSIILPYGDHTLDVELLSDFQTEEEIQQEAESSASNMLNYNEKPEFNSQMQLLIQKISLEGTIRGGAYECKKCPEGFVNDGSQAHCKICPAGFEPDGLQQECVKCQPGYHKQHKIDSGITCQKCPEFTRSTADGQRCVPYDVIVDKSNNRLEMHRLTRFDLFCKYGEHVADHCDEEDALEIGPIWDGPGGDVFYFAADFINSRRFVFHQKSQQEPGFIYQLQELRHVAVDDVLDYLEIDLPQSPDFGSNSLMEQMSAKIMLNQIGAHWANEEIAAGYDTYGFGAGIQRLVESKMRTKGRGKAAKGMKLDEFRKMVVLGRNVANIDTTADGVDVLFIDGDQCTEEEKYMAEVRYRCIVEDSDVGEDFSAEKLEYVGTEGSKCRHVFAWHTSLACPVCRKDQIVETRGQCENVRNRRLAKRAKIVDENGRPLAPEQIPAIVGVRKIAQKPAPGERCYVPAGEKIKGTYGDTDPTVYSAALGLQITEHEAAVLDQFAMEPLTFEQCNKLDDATAQAVTLFEESAAFRYSSSAFALLCACCCCSCVIFLLGYLNMRGEHARLYDEVSRENAHHGLPEDYDYDEDTRRGRESALPYEDEDMQHH